MKLYDYIAEVRWLQYSPTLAKMFSPTGAILLCWVIWRSRESGGKVEATYEAIESETGLSERNIETAKKWLVECGVLIVEQRRLQHVTLYSVDNEKLEEAWAAFRERPKRAFVRKAETDSPERPKRALEANIRTEQEQGKEQGASAPASGQGTGLPTGGRGEDPTGDSGSPTGEAPIGLAAAPSRAATGPGGPAPILALPGLSGAPSAKPASPTQVFKLGWCERFKRRTGENYVFGGGKDGDWLKKLLAHEDAESLLNLVDRCEGAPNDSAHWACKRALETVAKFASMINSVRSELAAKPMVRPVVQHVPEPNAIRETVRVPSLQF